MGRSHLCFSIPRASDFEAMLAGEIGSDEEEGEGGDVNAVQSTEHNSSPVEDYD